MLVSENIGKCLFVLLSTYKRLNKSKILDFIVFYKMSQLFLIWGCSFERLAYVFKQAVHHSYYKH